MKLLLTATIVLALCSCAFAVMPPLSGVVKTVANGVSAVANDVVDAAKTLANAVPGVVGAGGAAAAGKVQNPEAAALASIQNNLIGAINCAVKAAVAAGDGGSPKPPLTVGVSGPTVGPSAPVPKAVVPLAGGAVSSPVFVEEEIPIPPANALGPPTVPAPLGAGAGAGAGAGGAASTPESAGGPTTSGLVAHIKAIVAKSNGGISAPVTSDNIAAVCGSSGGAGAQQAKGAQQPKSTPGAPTPPKAVVPLAGGVGVGSTSLLQLSARFRRQPATTVPQTKGTQKAQKPQKSQKPQSATTPVGGDPLVGATDRVCQTWAKMGADLAKACPNAATDNSDIDISPLLQPLVTFVPFVPTEATKSVAPPPPK